MQTLPANKSASPFKVILAFATVYIVWGSTYFFIQRALAGFPPLVLGAVRFFIAGVLLMAWCMYKGEKALNKRDLITASVTGIMLLTIGTGIVIWVEQALPSGMVAIMVSSGPIWFVVLDRSKWKENFKSISTIAGLIFGFAGVLLLFGHSIMAAIKDSSKSLEVGFLALITFGTIFWAGGSLFSKYRGMSGSSSMSTSWQMLAAGIAFLPGSIITGEWNQMNWAAIPTGAWLSLCYLVLMGSIAGYSAFVWLLKVRPATQVSTHAYVNPVVAVLLGVFFANEQITWTQILGLIVILGSVLLINLAKYRKASPVPAETGQSKVKFLKIGKPQSQKGTKLHEGQTAK